MYMTEKFYKDETSYDMGLLKTEVNLDELDKNKVSLHFTPYEKDVVIKRMTYDDNDKCISVKTFDTYVSTFDYDKENDRIEIRAIFGFNDFIYAICVSLRIGRIVLMQDPKLDNYRVVFAFPYSIVLTLEEFKQLGGFCGDMNVNGTINVFKGLNMSLKHLYENKCDDFKRPDGKKEYFLRGEDLFIWD